ncbi:asparaginase [Paenibacillus sp. CCS19]|uniref:asparaginase n=1 Tax=Paenibacillus sp. CCS19 TaxID=3158387 RepID=UPI00255F98A8|nr:asparaginase [Paenibacillus cellulosilyticus]GMK42061.1 asparaginase [Paenibacillus cellulosilyticus]
MGTTNIERVENGGVPLAVTIRGAETENVHHGHIAVVDAEGQLIAWAGNADVPTFMRSTAKPVQVLPIISAGVMDIHQLPEAAIAMMTASHRGEPAHVRMLELMLRELAVREEELVFDEGLPLDADARDAYMQSGGKARKLFHNCAGKHIGLLAACKLEEWPMASYAELDHPIQQSIRHWIAELTEMSAADLTGGFDGCGLPVYTIPLSRLALLYARLAAPPASVGEDVRVMLDRITNAMNAEPDLVEGTGRLASLLLRNRSCVAKSGAQGVFALGLREEGLGLIIKMSDGSESAWPVVLASSIQQLASAGLLSSRIADQLSQQIGGAFPSSMYNDAGRMIGRREAIVQLQYSE